MKMALWMIGLGAAYAYLSLIVKLTSSIKNYRREQGVSVQRSSKLLVLSWMLFIALATILFWQLPNIFTGSLAIVIIFGFISLIAFKLGTQKISVIDKYFGGMVNPINAQLIKYLDGPFSLLSRKFVKLESKSNHTGIYDRNDLMGVLSRQGHQKDNLIKESELGLIRHVLNFGDKTCEQITIPIDRIRMVSADSPIGPHLMDELHKLPSKIVPVVAKAGNKKIIGTLYIDNLLDFSEGGTVGDVMHRDLIFVNLSTSLGEALHKFIDNPSKIALVNDQSGMVVGLIYEADIIKQLLGPQNFLPSN